MIPTHYALAWSKLQLIIFINGTIVLSINSQERIPLTSSEAFRLPTAQNIQFEMIYEGEKQQIFGIFTCLNKVND